MRVRNAFYDPRLEHPLIPPTQAALSRSFGTSKHDALATLRKRCSYAEGPRAACILSQHPCRMSCRNELYPEHSLRLPPKHDKISPSYVMGEQQVTCFWRGCDSCNRMDARTTPPGFAPAKTPTLPIYLRLESTQPNKLLRIEHQVVSTTYRTRKRAVLYGVTSRRGRERDSCGRMWRAHGAGRCT